MAVPEAQGKDAAPTVVIVDCQSIKTTEAGGPKGYDAGKKVKGRKRHIAVDTLGLPINARSPRRTFRIAMRWPTYWPL